ncbi:cytochrome P450 86A2-like [Impatiens glandulifera]|uniref:cytochrome P450 86A2-like n=1 Tax=Impatiens glandulifera TaxID=253017 RepID=UPI001FB13EC9|nr:cytochrome P450 86A2-like [Impatiens glandulifera]
MASSAASNYVVTASSADDNSTVKATLLSAISELCCLSNSTASELYCLSNYSASESSVYDSSTVSESPVDSISTVSESLNLPALEPSSTYVLLLLFLISLIISVIIPYVCRSFKCWHTTDPIPICWPVVRMLPALFHNSHRLHEFATDVLILTGGTFNIGGCLKDLSSRELGELVYLHGALCETLRLFPSVAFEHKSPLQPDVLPSGERVMPNTKIVLSFYSMGRMESIWGKDFMEFKPERWISDSNRNRNLHVPSFKFPAFNAGPRTCLGKEMAFTQMKIVASVILLRYEIQVMEDHPVMPASSIILHMKHGLKVRITPRD